MTTVFNKGKRPIVWERSRRGVFVLHPGKSDVFSEEKAKEVVDKFKDAVLESDYKATSQKGTK